MECKEFIESTILKLENKWFDELKKLLIEKKYLSFYFFSVESVSREVMAEKLCDYFEKVQRYNTNTFGKPMDFDGLLEKYISNWDVVVREKIAKEKKPTKKDPIHIIPRSRKYYQNIAEKKDDLSFQNIIDFSRVMMCLYVSIIKNAGNVINDFDYSTDCLNITQIINSLRKEQNGLVKNLRFDLKDRYDTDRCTFIIIIIMFYHIKNNEIVGEY